MPVVKFTLPLRTDLADRVDRLATGQTRTRNQQVNVLIERALNLGERLPEVEPSGDGDSYESAHAYRERLRYTLDGGV